MAQTSPNLKVKSYKLDNGLTVLLNEDPISPGSDHIYKQFEVTIALRNMKNFVRSISL